MPKKDDMLRTILGIIIAVIAYTLILAGLAINPPITQMLLVAIMGIFIALIIYAIVNKIKKEMNVFVKLAIVGTLTPIIYNLIAVSLFPYGGMESFLALYPIALLDSLIMVAAMVASKYILDKS